MIKQDTLENRVKKVYLGIGSNLGNKKLNIEKAKTRLELHKIKILKCSNSYETDSWPNPTNPKFINVVVEIKTIIDPVNLLKICKSIEVDLGRKKTKKNDPRICDIDIIDYNHQILKENTQGLILPHYAMHNRSFVLLPLFELNPSWKHPITKINIIKLMNSLPIQDLRSIKQI